MTLRRTFDVTDEGRIPGLHVIGFQGAVDPASTPALRAPVLVDADRRLSRVVDYRTGQSGPVAEVESIEPPLPAEGPLPGVATRLEVSPLSALADGVVAILGRSERPIVHHVELDHPGVPARVAAFLRWFRDDSGLDDDATWGRTEGGLWACLLTGGERRALWKLLHAEVFRSLRVAVRAEDPARMTNDAFWLSRVVVHPDPDFYHVAYALRLAPSPHWKLMLREGLRLKDESAWDAGLKEAAYTLSDHHETAQAPPRCYKARDEVRRRAANP